MGLMLIDFVYHKLKRKFEGLNASLFGAFFSYFFPPRITAELVKPIDATPELFLYISLFLSRFIQPLSPPHTHSSIHLNTSSNTVVIGGTSYTMP